MNSYLSLEAASSASRRLLVGTSAPWKSLLNVYVDGQALDALDIMECAPQLWVWVRCDPPTVVPQATSTEPSTAAASQEARAYVLKWIMQKKVQDAGKASRSATPRSSSHSSSTALSEGENKVVAEEPGNFKWKECNSIIERIGAKGHLDQRDSSIMHLRFENDVSVATSADESVTVKPDGIVVPVANSCREISVLTVHTTESTASRSTEDREGECPRIVVLLGEGSSIANTPTKFWGVDALSALDTDNLIGDGDSDIDDTHASNGRAGAGAVGDIWGTLGQRATFEAKLTESLTLLQFQGQDGNFSLEDSLI